MRQTTGTGSTRCRVLIVDDNADVAASLAMLLELDGHEVRTATDGESALHLAEQFEPEFAALSIGLPKMNGYDVCRRLRVTAQGKRMLIVAITGYGEETGRRRSRQVGFNLHLVKLVDPTEIQRLVADLAAH